MFARLLNLLSEYPERRDLDGSVVNEIAVDERNRKGVVAQTEIGVWESGSTSGARILPTNGLIRQKSVGVVVDTVPLFGLQIEGTITSVRQQAVALVEVRERKASRRQNSERSAQRASRRR